jgi:hypothetical protein
MPLSLLGGSGWPLRRPDRAHAVGRDPDPFPSAWQVELLAPAVIIDAPDPAVPPEGLIGFGVPDVLGRLSWLPEGGALSLAAQEPLPDRLDGWPVTPVAQGGAHALLALGSGAHEFQHLLCLFISRRRFESAE